MSQEQPTLTGFDGADPGATIVLPGTPRYVAPAGVSNPKADIAESLNKSRDSFRTKRTDPTDYTTLNNYTPEQWKTLEDAGALFLPFIVITELGGKTYYSGEYWTTDDNYNSIAPQEIWPKRGCNQSAFRMAIRLAKNVK